MKKILLIISITALIIGCADTARIIQDPSYQQLSLKKSAVTYVSIPKNGSYGNSIYSGSGQSVSTIIRSSLLKHLLQADEGIETENYKQALSSAQTNGADYLFFPTILHWEDRATEWSGIADKAQIKIVIIDVKNSKTLSSVIINGSSGLATFGGDHPQDLLPEPVDKYINSLFGK